MHLLVIGHTAHYRREGQIVGWGPTIKEIDWLAKACDQLTHLACFHDLPAPPSALPYTATNVQLVTVPPSGGLNWRAKWRVLQNGAHYLAAIRRLLPQADLVQVRCPGSLGMYGMLAVSASPKTKNWIKYAGNWSAPEAPSHRFQQKWLEKGWHHGPVTINGRWAGQPRHVFSFLNPSLTKQDVEQARILATDKQLSKPTRFIFVGHTTLAKGFPTVLQIFEELTRRLKSEVLLEVIGESPSQEQWKNWVAEKGLTDWVQFHGWLPHAHVLQRLVEAHFILLPSQMEGWPKVLSEAMSFGAVPLASAISAIPQILAETGAGFAFPVGDVLGYVEKIVYLLEHPARWHELKSTGIAAAPQFTYERYLFNLNQMLQQFYGTSPLKDSNDTDH